MGGGNGQKSKTARERNLEKQKAAKGTHTFPLRIRGEQEKSFVKGTHPNFLSFTVRRF